MTVSLFAVHHNFIHFSTNKVSLLFDLPRHSWFKIECLKQLHLLRKLLEYCQREEYGCSSKLNDPLPYKKSEKRYN